METPIRVLIADDHFIIREGLRLILEAVEDIELVGVAADGAEAVRLTGELQPAVVLMDLRMPGMDGLAALERLRLEQAHVAVVILTTYNEDDLMRRGLRAGACSYLLKDTSGETLLNTIRAAARGEMLLKPELIAGLLADNTPSAPLTTPVLTEREGEVLAAVARGERSKEIATHLGITERTVKAHLANIYNKLGVDSRAAAIAVAARHGLLAGESET
jgi:NarL family two-component system response regulator YdfI